MNSSYKLILFDFFNTLALPDASNTPMLAIQGRQVISTAGILREFLEGVAPGIKTRDVFRAMEEARRQIQGRWGPDLKEPPGLERFRCVVKELGLKAPDGRLAENLLARHMRALVRAYFFPAAHLRMLERLRASYRLGIFSNFDHAPALRRFLGRAGVRGWFDPVVISGAIGYRKPGRVAFERALKLAAQPIEEILFVGDSLAEDVAGAVAAGLDVVWINRTGAPPPQSPRANHVVSDLLGLEQVLERG